MAYCFIVLSTVIEKGMLHQGLKVKKLNNFSNFKSVVSEQKINLASFIGPLRLVRLDKNHFFYFHPSKRDCSRLKGACQRRSDTGKPSKGSRFVY